MSSRLIWLTMTLGYERWVFVGAYGPGSEQERNDFREELSECLSSLRTDENVILLGDLNRRVGNEEIDGVTGKFGVPGVNENGERLIEVCSDLGLLIGNTCFKKRMIHKYTWKGVAHGEVFDKAMR